MPEMLFESYALNERESKEREFTVDLAQSLVEAILKGIKAVLIDVLGLSLGTAALRREDGTTPSHLPMVFFVTKPEVLNEIIQKEKEAASLDPSSPEANAAEVMNEHFMKMDSVEMETLFSRMGVEDPKQAYLETHLSTLRSMGIELTSSEKTELLKEYASSSSTEVDDG